MFFFKKSTRSGPWTDNCVEVGTDWQKSSFSTANAQCVEVQFQPHAETQYKDGEPVTVYVRDSKDNAGPVLGFTDAEWKAFIEGAKDGEFDLPEAVPASS